MEKEFMMWLIKNQIISTDTLMDKYSDHLPDDPEPEDYLKILEDLCDVTIKKYKKSKKSE